MSAPKTDSQQQILALFKQLNREISAQELYVELRRRSQSLGLATIYRALKALKLEGTIQKEPCPTVNPFTAWQRQNNTI